MSERSRGDEEWGMMRIIFKPQQRGEHWKWPPFYFTTKRDHEDAHVHTLSLNNAFLQFAFGFLLGRHRRIPQICGSIIEQKQLRGDQQKGQGSNDDEEVCGGEGEDDGEKGNEFDEGAEEEEDKIEKVIEEREEEDDDEDDDDDDDDDDEKEEEEEGVTREEEIEEMERDREDNEFLEGLSTEEFVTATEAILMEALKEGDLNALPLPSADDDLSAFFGVGVPSISIRDYITRLIMYAEAPPAAFVMMHILMRRLGMHTAVLRTNEFNLHRVLITALLIASKMSDDKKRRGINEHFASVGGVPSCFEMSTLELLFLQFIRNEIAIDETTFFDMVAELRTTSAALMAYRMPTNEQDDPDEDAGADAEDFTDSSRVWTVSTTSMTTSTLNLRACPSQPSAPTPRSQRNIVTAASTSRAPRLRSHRVQVTADSGEIEMD